MAKEEKGKEIGMVKLDGCRCRCGHEWLPRDKTEKPRVCPKCKTPNWDRRMAQQIIIRSTKLRQAKKEQSSNG